MAEANQAVFFNRGQDCAISHPVGAGDACLSVSLAVEIFSDLEPEKPP